MVGVKPGPPRTDDVVHMAVDTSARRAAPLDVEGVLDLVLTSAGRLFDGQGGSIMLLVGGQELEVVASPGNPAALGARVKLGEGVAGQVAKNRDGALITGRGSKRAKPVDFGMSVPLLHGDALFGVLNINANAGHRFSDYDLHAATQFAAAAADALVEARSYEDARRAGDENPYRHLTAMLDHLRRACRLEFIPHTPPDRIDVGSVVRTVADGMNVVDRPVEVRGPLHIDAKGVAAPLRRALNELADNSHRHGAMPVRMVIEPGDWVSITVTDAGPGVPIFQAHKLFEPYVRLERDTDGPGVGLGLTIVQQAVEAIGGKVEAVPVPLGHTGFRISLPAG